jgi:hypothetical protein
MVRNCREIAAVGMQGWFALEAGRFKRILAGDAMSEDKREGKHRLCAVYGFETIAVGCVVLLIATVRADVHNWQGYLLGGVSLALGAFLLAWAALRE